MSLGNVLVTGGSGFIGSHLVELALENSRNVTVVDLQPESTPDARHVIVDISDRDNLFAKLPETIDTIFHLAARTSVLQSIKDPQGVFNTNVIGTHNILELARASGTRRVLLASTNAVVGNFSGGKITETSPLRPLTPYGSTKAAAEVLSNAYLSSYGVGATQLRLTNVYGEGMSKKDSIVPRLMRTALGQTSFSIYGDGEQYRDYVYVKDVARAFLDLAIANYDGPVIIGSGESLTVNFLIEKASLATGVEIPFDRIAAQPGEMRGVLVDNSLARSLGIRFEVEMDEGLERTWLDFKSNR